MNAFWHGAGAGKHAHVLRFQLLLACCVAQHVPHPTPLHPTPPHPSGRDSRLRSVGNDEREQTLNQLLTGAAAISSRCTNSRHSTVVCPLCLMFVVVYFDVSCSLCFLPQTCGHHAHTPTPCRAGRL
jgi:hypothetical protein